MTNPRDTIIRLSEYFWLIPIAENCPKPGQAYLRLPESARKILSQLRSEDIRDIRPFWLTSSRSKASDR